MNLGFYNLYPKCNQNRMFATGNADIGDDLFYAMWNLGETLKKLGHTFATIDTAPLETFDAVVFCDYPTKLRSHFRQALKSGKPLYLIITEGPAVWPFNWNPANHAPFKKIFTWSPSLVDGKKYIHMHVGFRLPEFTPYAPSRAEKFCCLISSQKYSWAAGELYSERVRAIRWFERHHPDEFDLYGQRWDRFYFKKRLSGINLLLNRAYSMFPWLPRSRSFPSYRGTVDSKRKTLPNYKFSIAYENAGYPGWLTEKPLDPMFAGCVPVYLGDPEVTKIIPKEAFIDKRDFPTYEALYCYLKGMSAAEYEGYRQAIHKFVHGEAIKVLGADAFADLIVREVVNAHPVLAAAAGAKKN
jgi:hypothetical protein